MSTNENSKPNELRLSNDELHHSNENLDNNTWFPTGEMHYLSTKINKDSLLPKTTRTEILKNQPHNSEIKYEAPSIDKQIWKLMSPQAKEPDKLLAKVAYHSFAILRPLDNSLRAIYNIKPDNNDEALMAWEYNETALKDTRSLLLDSLSYTNEIRKQQFQIAIKDNNIKRTNFKPTYVKSNPCFGQVQRAITGHITEHKIRETGFGGIISPVRMNTINRLVMAYEHYQKWLPPRMDHTPTIELLSSKSTPSYFSRNISRDTETSGKMCNNRIDYKHTMFFVKDFYCLQKYGSARLIIDLRNLNTYIHPSHFKMKTMQTVKALMKQNDYMTSIDIQDTFYHVSLSLHSMLETIDTNLLLFPLA
ncbi:10389_t:CDS:2 [Gigaspora margarita]|uniref:10389_t:CDS:1 n=1 Tax=Gigaspora margarita TaxID=4874 RepID=A0ABN7W5F9_GIGMA|nr:10389_t:CDS:2 [Gigaspora margarita]